MKEFCCDECERKESKKNIMPDKCIICDMSKLFKVLSDSTRIKILYSLLDCEKCVCDIQEDVGMSQSSVSHQLKALKNLKLVKFTKVANNVIYSLDDDHVKTILNMVHVHLVEKENE